MADDLTLAGDNPLALLQEETKGSLVPQSKLSYVGFHTKKSEHAIDIAAAIPSIVEGEPYLFDGTQYRKVDSLSLAGPNLHYWAELDDDHKIERASLTLDRSDRDLKEAVLAIALAYCDGQVYPAMSTFKTTKAPAAKDLVNARSRFDDSDKVAESGPIGKQLAKLPVSLRIAGDVDVLNKKTKPNEKGKTFPYQIARCRTRLLNDVETQALFLALNDDEFNDKVRSLTELYNSRVAMINKVANEG